ncbi:unnamed protein product [Vitrella brassicaformis CCMP3155]|uniref:Uncharacterized protein n=1 Tax=Vitrella brassicaformis (strain CCMP3155) TaxID=1169540 RepID=A0A0G4ESR2_VITBC|nr:unnamed protein product [Vitrella brassicaformis CCMP3155]|eukprot:CEM00913.1 unnamed protein product [Vitrella brassicaformis CCMP3155]
MGCPIDDVYDDEWDEQFAMIHEAVYQTKINDYLPYPGGQGGPTVKQECWEDFAKICAQIGAQQVLWLRQMKVRGWGEAHVRAQEQRGERPEAPQPAEDGMYYLHVTVPPWSDVTPQDTATEPRSEVATGLLPSERAHAAATLTLPLLSPSTRQPPSLPSLRWSAPPSPSPPSRTGYSSA